MENLLVFGMAATYVHLDENQILGDHWFRAWIETGSDSKAILVTLAESNNAGFISSVSGAYRNVNGKHGVFLTVNIAGGKVPAGMTVDLCVLQGEADHYEKPVLYTGE